MKKIGILIFTAFVSMTLFANPKIYEGANATGTSTTVPYVGEYIGANLQPDPNDLEYYSPPLTYYVVGVTNAPNIIGGSNGTVKNKSVYVPKCWMMVARILPKDNYPASLGTGYIKFDALNDFPVINYILPEGSHDLEAMGWNDQIVGYGGYKIPDCSDPSAELTISRPRYEPIYCRGSLRRGELSWVFIPGATYTVQQNSGGTWYTIYSGSNNYFGYNQNGGSYSLRIRASANGAVGPWRAFTAFVPACTPGGGGTIPF
jgi:hypothetical protein